MKIGLLSDTHGHTDATMLQYLRNCQEIWHAGDIGDLGVLEALEQIAPVRAVWGNIDSAPIRHRCPEEQYFECEGLRVWMIHIGGYPPRYTTVLRKKIETLKPALFICGHSHILRVIPDPERGVLHINPGAAGHHGFHLKRTMVRFEIENGKVMNLEVIEIGNRGHTIE
jgi:putative phosphoesterase